MHVKESVKEFVHDVKRRFSQKRKRDSCATCASESFDETSSISTADTHTHFYSKRDSTSSSSISSAPTTPERTRFVTLARLRKPSNTSIKHHHNAIHKVRGGKRYKPFSLERAAEPQSNGAQAAGRWSPLSIQDAGDESMMMEFSQREYTEVLDISSAWSVKTEGSAHNSTQTGDTLVTAASGPDEKKSASKSDSCHSAVNLPSDTPPLLSPMPPSDSAADLGEEEITLAANLDKSTTAPSPTTTPAQPKASTPASPAPVYLPRLTAPSMFLPIPNTDPPSALLTKHVPAEQRPRRDVVGEYAGRDVHDMIMSNSWRALAKMARDRIVASDPEDLGRILDLWSLRLSSLARLRLTNQASAECTNLFAVLNAVPPTSVPGSFPGSGSLLPSVPLPASPTPAASLSLSPSGLSGLAQLPGTPSQKASPLPPLPPGGTTSATAPRQGANELLHPFELTVFHARVHYWSGDPLGYVDALSRILGRCKERAREEGRVVAQRRERRVVVGGDVEGFSQSERANEDADEESTDDAKVQGKEELDAVLVAAEANLSMWLERIARVCLILASQMIEMNDYQAAINLLVPLCTYRVPPTLVPTPSPTLHSALARIYLLSGNLRKAEEHFSIATSAAGNSANRTDIHIVVMNTALLAAASGEWTRAEEALGELVAKNPGNFTAINNLAVTLLCQGRIKEGIDLLEAALKMSPSSVVVAEPFLFNLSTLYELRSTTAIDKKRELLLQVAKWSGDGLKMSCLKMPSS
ncbi:hypothetical protein J3R82DRAFT_2525 [Butyriboletus roseoflavus]|nr:hypothetical protein J3R82DRAFT_2525 [Butyriboletus roseoflavus]